MPLGTRSTLSPSGAFALSHLNFACGQNRGAVPQDISLAAKIIDLRSHAGQEKLGGCGWARKLSQSQAAVDGENLARQPLRGGARKLDNPFRDIFGNAAPPERNPCALVFLDGFCLSRR
jgi:hypothetical protein